MFELRQLQKQSGEIVLQQRTKTVHVDSPTTTAVSCIWTEWQDVPLVKEASASVCRESSGQREES